MRAKCALRSLRDNGGDDVTVPREVINTDVDALAFPPDFLFGVATSAHQIEGGDGGLNQWSAWECSKDKQGVVRNDNSCCSSSRSELRRHPYCQRYVPAHSLSRSCPFVHCCVPQSRIKDGSRVSSGGQHWLRVDEDVKLLRELGVNSYRFSIEWSKVQTGPGDNWNQSAIQHYSDEIDQLLANNITPMITLQHFTIPTWCVLR